MQAVRPEGAEAHSPRQRPGLKTHTNHTPCKGKSLINKVLPFLLWQAAKPSPGRIVHYIYNNTQGAALGYVVLPLRGVSLASFDTPYIKYNL